MVYSRDHSVEEGLAHIVSIENINKICGAILEEYYPGYGWVMMTLKII